VSFLQIVKDSENSFVKKVSIKNHQKNFFAKKKTNESDCFENEKEMIGN